MYTSYSTQPHLAHPMFFFVPDFNVIALNLNALDRNDLCHNGICHSYGLYTHSHTSLHCTVVNDLVHILFLNHNDLILNHNDLVLDQGPYMVLGLNGFCFSLW